MNLLKRGSAGSPKSSEAPVPERTGIDAVKEEEGAVLLWEVGGISFKPVSLNRHAACPPQDLLS